MKYLLFLRSEKICLENFVGADCCLSNREPFSHVHILSPKHERRLGEFEKAIRARYAVKGLHNFQEIS